MWKRSAAALERRFRRFLSLKCDSRAFSVFPYSTSQAPKPQASVGFSTDKLRKFVKNFKGDYPNEDADQEKVVSLCLSLGIQTDTRQELKKWLASGNSLTQGIVSRVSAWLIRRRHMIVALNFMSTVREDGLVEMTSRQYIREITLVCSRLGPGKAQFLFRSMPEPLKTEEVTTAFLVAVAKEKFTGRVEKWLDELGLISVEAWSEILHMYLKKDRHDKLREIYYRFKEKGVKPNIHTYWAVLECRHRVGGFQEIEMEVDAELRRIDLEKAGTQVLNLMMRCYALLGKRKRVDRVWKLLTSKVVASPNVDSYLCAIKSFGLFGDLDKAYEVLEELLAKHEIIFENPYIWIVEICVRLKMMDEAEKVMKKHIDKGCFAPYNFLITGYLESGKVPKALQKLDEAFTFTRFKDRQLHYKTVMALLPLFARRKEIYSAEKIMANYASCGDLKVYKALLKVYVSAKRMPNYFLERLQNHKLEPDEDILTLMDTLHSFWDHKPGRRTIWPVVNGRRVRQDEHMSIMTFKRKWDL